MKNIRRKTLLAPIVTITALLLLNACCPNCDLSGRPRRSSSTNTSSNVVKKPVSILTSKINFAINNNQAPLKYAFNALEVAIDKETMNIHYSKHAAAYCKNYNDACREEAVNDSANIQSIIQSISSYSTKMKNNAGGHFNHELFWQELSPQPKAITNRFRTRLQNSFGSIDSLKAKFSDVATKHFGSGWIWLILTPSNQLLIVTTDNQNNPMMNTAITQGYPLIALDVWEHSYYLKYQNKRADYIQNFWNVLDWSIVEERYNKVFALIKPKTVS